MTSHSSPPIKRNSPDWRNTLYEFHHVAVPKYKLRSQAIALYTALFSKVKKDGHVSMGNDELMLKSGIASNRTFWKARDRLIEVGIIEIVKIGNVQKECTLYKIKLRGRPNCVRQNKGGQDGVSN